MRPIFTIHAGEFLFGDYLERSFSGIHVWIPAKDIGIDLIVTDASNKKIVSFQVKFSKDYLLTHAPEYQNSMRSYGWWALNREKIRNSSADYWVFVLMTSKTSKQHSFDFVVIKPATLLHRLEAIHGRQKIFQTYMCITEKERCWETRNLKTSQEDKISEGIFRNKARDFTAFLNDLPMIPGRRKRR